VLKIKIFSPGKTKEQWLSEALIEYEKRLSREMSIEWVQNYEGLVKESSYLCLDSQGKSFSSPEFSKFFYKEVEKGGARLSIVIGGPEGIPDSIRLGAAECISFSKLTFTHQMVRLILLEQLYRATQIAKGTKYHK